jgi:hypothetical protein
MKLLFLLLIVITFSCKPKIVYVEKPEVLITDSTELVSVNQLILLDTAYLRKVLNDSNYLKVRNGLQQLVGLAEKEYKSKRK